MTDTATHGSTQLEGFDDFARGVLKEWNVPGAAVSIVKDGDVVLSRGYGDRDVDADLPVTPDTLFAIGSTTKAFTTAAMGILVDEGKLDWDTPVRRYLPAFAMHDAVAAERMTPRDLTTHRSGLPRHDLSWYNSPASREELVNRLQYLQPSKDFRTVFQYQNLMYMTAGYLVGKQTNGTWEDFVQARIFNPLGMSTSNFSVEQSQSSDDFALPYAEKDGAVERIPFRGLDQVGPAGSINSSANEMSAWLQLHLNNGKYGDTQIISEKQLKETHTPQIILERPFDFEEIPLTSYSLGWAVSVYRGHEFIQHTGGIDGFIAIVAVVPRKHFGTVILTNLNGTIAPSVLMYDIFDRFLGLEPVDWSGRYRRIMDEQKAATARASEKVQTDRIQGTMPSHPLKAYVGEYENPGYGTVSIRMDGDGLTLSHNQMTHPLTHYHYDLFQFSFERFELDLIVTFSTGLRGDIQQLSIPFEPMVDAIEFKRTPDKPGVEPDFPEPISAV